MTYEQAYAIWKGNSGATAPEYAEMTELVSKAILKQTPKKPKETDAYPHRLYCPCCSWTLCYNKENADGFRMMNMFLYCPECGQAIDWSDNE